MTTISKYVLDAFVIVAITLMLKLGWDFICQDQGEAGLVYYGGHVALSILAPAWMITRLYTEDKPESESEQSEE